MTETARKGDEDIRAIQKIVKIFDTLESDDERIAVLAYVASREGFLIIPKDYDEQPDIQTNSGAPAFSHGGGETN